MDIKYFRDPLMELLYRFVSKYSIEIHARFAQKRAYFHLLIDFSTPMHPSNPPMILTRIEHVSPPGLKFGLFSRENVHYSSYYNYFPSVYP